MDHLQSRRQFLKFISSHTTALSLSPLLLNSLAGCTTLDQKPLFSGIDPTRKDALVLADGLKYNIIAQYNDVLNKDKEVFGYNNDYTTYLPLQNKDDEGLLWVNHESVIPQFIHNKEKKNLTRSINEIIKEQELVGGSILHIKKVDDQWQLVQGSKYNRRVHGRTKIPFSHGFKIQGSNTAVGTLANCAGGQTPWKTFLTSEENYDTFYGEAQLHKGKRSVTHIDKFNWWKHFPLPPEHYGWIVEIDPFTGKAEKQVLLGRAPHEGATVVVSNNRAVVYMGEDRGNGYLFKFVSDGLHFKSGTLYAADTINGRWLPLDIEKSPILKTNFSSQLEVLTYAHQAAELLGATPQDRPEDIEVHPTTGDVFIALTKNWSQGNLYGSLLKISEAKDHTSLEFKASTWISGGLKTGMACPDNLCFDNKGNLWVTNDMSEKEMGSDRYKAFGNNGLFYIPLSGPGAGLPIQVASAPIDAELTGPSFSSDYKTLFLSVQHPGSSGRDNFKKPTSLWPDGQGHHPKPAVVAIEGSLLNRLTR